MEDENNRTEKIWSSFFSDKPKESWNISRVFKKKLLMSFMNFCRKMVPPLILIFTSSFYLLLKEIKFFITAKNLSMHCTESIEDEKEENTEVVKTAGKINQGNFIYV